MNCWTCGKTLQDLERKVSFRATCDHCGAALHCCKNCRHYSPGRANDCAIPGTDFIADRSANNFCEEFSLLGKASPPKVSNSKFDDLFK